MASGKPPVTRHPLFPATVALWFGALFGIGSLAVRPALIESALTALHLDALITVPIGPTTRILIALALAGAGGLLGARLARRIGQPKPVARPRKRGAMFTGGGAESPTPGEAAASPTARPARRTQLAIPDNGHGEPQYYDRVPVPGSAQILDVSQFGLEGFEPEAEHIANQDTAPARPDVDEAREPESAEEAPFLPGPGYDEPRDAPASPAVAAPAAEPAPAAPVLPRLGSEDAPEVPATARSLFESAPAPSLFAQPLKAQVSEVRWQDGPAPAEQSPAASPAETPAAASAGDPSAAERIASARLDDLAPIELLERLAISLREKRSRAASADIPAASAVDLPAAESEAEDDSDNGDSDDYEAPAVMAAPIAPPVPTIPAALRPVGLDPEDDEDALPGYIPPRRIGTIGQTYSAPLIPTSGQNGGESGAADGLDLEGGYSSLLNLSRPAPQPDSPAQRFVRIEEPEPLTDEIEPVVVFPNQVTETTGTPRDTAGVDGGSADTADNAPPDSAPNGRDPEETERALRSALANIQRMSGAA